MEPYPLPQKDNISFAFGKFLELKHPIAVDKRIYSPDHRLAFHKHDFPQIWYCIDGNYLHFVEDAVIPCQKGSFLVIPAGVRHRFQIPQGAQAELASVNISYDALTEDNACYLNTMVNLFLPAFSKELGHSFPVCRLLSPRSQAATEEYLSWLALLRFTPTDMFSTADSYKKLEEIFSLPELALPSQFRKRALQLIQTRLCPILRMLCYLNIHYPEKIAEEALLQKIGISRAGMYRYFKQYMGYTYSQYLQRLRVARANVYLMYTNYSISCISDMCGFYDTHHMTKAMSRYLGQTPGRKRARKK